jgi:hypothetical protein
MYGRSDRNTSQFGNNPEYDNNRGGPENSRIYRQYNGYQAGGAQMSAMPYGRGPFAGGGVGAANPQFGGGQVGDNSDMDLGSGGPVTGKGAYYDQEYYSKPRRGCSPCVIFLVFLGIVGLSIGFNFETAMRFFNDATGARDKDDDKSVPVEPAPFNTLSPVVSPEPEGLAPIPGDGTTFVEMTGRLGWFQQLLNRSTKPFLHTVDGRRTPSASCFRICR